MSWVDKVISQHNELESPSNFWYWSALCTISAVMKDNVWLDRWRYHLFPNIYVMLHADSGLKKSPPVSLARRLVRKVNNTRILSGRSSIQGILKELGTYTSSPGGAIRNKSHGFIVASEFTSSLVADPAAMTILTDLYDRQNNEGEWKSLLKMETFELRDPTITLLVATNEAHFNDFVEAKDIHGGFIGRTFVIAESAVHRLNSLAAPLRAKFDEESLLNYLEEISKLRGPFQPFGSLEESDLYHNKREKHDEITGERWIEWFTDMGAVYDDWYLEFHDVVKKQDVKDATGTIQRFGDSVLKVAMLLSLSDSPNKIISLENIKESIRVCETLIGNVRRTTFTKQSKSISADNKARIINEVMERDNHQVSRAMLLKKYYMHFNASDLDDIMQTFHQSGLIVAEQIGDNLVYKMPEDQYQEMKRMLGEKKK